jgi:RND superfamily putative drug exporter
VSHITRWVLAHKRIVVLSWVVLTVVGIATVNKATQAMDQKFSVPGKEGWETNVAISEHFHGTGGDVAPIVPVVTLPQGKTVDSPGVDAQLNRVDGELHQGLPGSRIASYASTGNRAFVSKDGRTTFAIVYPKPDPNAAFGENPDAAKDARAAMNGVTVAGAPVHVSGFDALQNESGGDSGTGVLLESVLGGAGALIVLAFVFASLLALLPMAMAIVSIMTTFLLVWGLTAFTDVSPVVQFLIALVGLGIAIDYSLLIASRWREERRTRGGVQRDDRGHRVVGDGCVAGPVPAEHRLRGPADPPRQHAGRHHPAPGPALEVRPQAGLAAPAHR